MTTGTRGSGAYDTVIAGNGALGLALAFELGRRGQSVCVVGPAAREGGASAAAGAMNGCFGEVTRELLGSAHGRMKLQLDVQAADLWDPWTEEVAAAGGATVAQLRRKTGTVVILNAIGTGPIDSANFASIQTALETYKRPFSLLDEDDIEWISPQETSRAFRGLHLPDEHSVDTPMYLAALEAAVEKVGGHLVDGLIRSVVADGEPAPRIILQDGRELSAGQVVLAAGAHSHTLLSDALPDLAKLAPPMLAGCGVSVLVSGALTRPLNHVIRTPNRAFACGLHAAPRTGGIYIGATNIMSNRPHSRATISDLTFLLDCAMKQLHTDLTYGRIEKLQVGNRPVPIDGFPLIGRLADTPIWMMTGTYRDGFHQSPLLARQMAEALCSGRTESLIADFAPIRPPIQAASRSQVVATAMEHMLASGFEWDWRVPPKWSTRLKADLLQKYEIAANELHETYTPPAEVLAFSVDNPWLKDRLQAYYDAYPPATRSADRPLDALAG